jgi:hypothetical protein
MVTSKLPLDSLPLLIRDFRFFLMANDEEMGGETKKKKITA